MRAQDARLLLGLAGCHPHGYWMSTYPKAPLMLAGVPWPEQGLSSRDTQQAPTVHSSGGCQVAPPVLNWSGSCCPSPHGLPGLAMRCPGLFFQQAWAGWKMTSEGGVTGRLGGVHRVSWGAGLGFAELEDRSEAHAQGPRGALPLQLIRRPLATVAQPLTLGSDGGLTGRRRRGASGGFLSHHLDT